MSLRRATSLFAPISRRLATEGKLIGVAVDDKTGTATITLQRPPVNSLNLELLTEFSKVLDDLGKNKCRGMILTSSSNSVFSGGLDIMEMFKPDKQRLKEFWTALQEAWIKLYGSHYPTVACINGHAPAGGCLLSMSCEYRVMLDNFTIGLNETQLGMVVPTWFVDTMINTIGRRQTEAAVARGRLFTTEEAHKIGLIDEIASNKEIAMKKCEEFLAYFNRLPAAARAMNKNSVRASALEKLIKNREQDLNIFLNFVVQESVQKNIGFYLESLKKKK